MKYLSAVLLFSCTFLACNKDQPQPDPANNLNNTGCFLLTQDELGTIIKYTYDNDYLITSAEISGKFTNFEYDTKGRLIKAVKETLVATMTYSGENEYPNRIDVVDDGTPLQFFVISQNAGLITKVETYASSDPVNAQQILSLTYSGTALTRVQVDVYDAFSQTYYAFIDAKNISTDGKINLLAQSLATIYMNIDNPFAYTHENIVDAELYVLEQFTEFNAAYTYNDKDYTLSMDITIPGYDKDLIFTYDCVE